MILDKLLEKKDVKTMLNLRRDLLQESKSITKDIEDAKKRHVSWTRIDGRLQEIEYILSHLDNIKEHSKELYKERARILKNKYSDNS